jgi:hypothetical protein
MVAGYDFLSDIAPHIQSILKCVETKNDLLVKLANAIEELAFCYFEGLSEI